MGQYYNAVVGNDTEKACIKREINGEYVMAKLMEHSWWRNDYCNNVALMIYNKPQRVIWLGDYAEPVSKTGKGEDTCASKTSTAKEPVLLADGWGDDMQQVKGLRATTFTLWNKFLINHDTKEYVKCRKFYQNSKDNTNWVTHPLPLLTANGGAGGGGDFYSSDEEQNNNVGIWAWNLLEISNKIPAGYTEKVIKFVEN